MGAQADSPRSSDLPLYSRLLRLPALPSCSALLLRSLAWPHIIPRSRPALPCRSAGTGPSTSAGSSSAAFYLVPDTKYEYFHPEGTGHSSSPFDSIWFCHLGKDSSRVLAWWEKMQKSKKPTVRTGVGNKGFVEGGC